MKITAFDKVVAREIAKATEAALADVCAKYGVEVKYKGGSFTSNTFNPKIEFSVVSEDGTAITREVEDFKRYSEMFGLSPEDFGKEFRSNGQVFKVCGLKPNSPKLPVLAKALDGRVFKFQASAVAAKLHTV
jgi:hypothetical protein